MPESVTIGKFAMDEGMPSNIEDPALAEGTPWIIEDDALAALAGIPWAQMKKLVFEGDFESLQEIKITPC